MRPHIAKLDLFATRFIQSRTLVAVGDNRFGAVTLKRIASVAVQKRGGTVRRRLRTVYLVMKTQALSTPGYRSPRPQHRKPTTDALPIFGTRSSVNGRDVHLA